MAKLYFRYGVMGAGKTRDLQKTTAVLYVLTAVKRFLRWDILPATTALFVCARATWTLIPETEQANVVK